MAQLAGYKEVSSARAPDFKIAEKNAPCQVGLVGFMELKTTIDGESKDIEQAIEYCRILLGLQPFRACTFCVLTDLHAVKILQVTRSQALIHHGRFIEEGLPLLWYLMTTPNTDIFNELPVFEFPNITYNSLKAIGKGKTSTVYKVELTDSLLGPTEKYGVIKAYFDDFTHLMEEEKQNLLDLAGCESGIPKLIAQGSPPSILMIPYCHDMKRFERKDCEQIAHILKHVHSKHIIHRDLHQTNLLLANNSVVINDWGFAAKEFNISHVFHQTIYAHL
ncbi:hypothetical protein K7432_015445 [Basidiobolus ranarum]|uniref:Protein kinase domain-containing protein n=1 Tax=Basidiobolus ranarum TaxID=34480 RepID=A0ABR2VN89_9FUNG